MGSGHSRARRRSSLGHGQTVPAWASNLNPAQVTALWSSSPPRSRLATGHCRLLWPGPRRRGPGEAGDLMSLRWGHRGSESVSHSPRRSRGGGKQQHVLQQRFPQRRPHSCQLPSPSALICQYRVDSAESPHCPPPRRPSDKLACRPRPQKCLGDSRGGWMDPLHFLTPVQTTMVPSLCLPHNTGSPRAFCRDTEVGVLGRRGPAAVSCQVRWCNAVPTQALILVLPGAPGKGSWRWGRRARLPPWLLLVECSSGLSWLKASL